MRARRAGATAVTGAAAASSAANLPICFAAVKRVRRAPCTAPADPSRPAPPAAAAAGVPGDSPPSVLTGTPRTPVLILARESVIAALLGLLLELEDYAPVFAEPDERPEDAIARLRPPLVVLLDGGLDAARSDLFFARAAAARARVVLFSEPVAVEDVQRAARHRRVPFLPMPVDRATLGRVLAAGAAG